MSNTCFMAQPFDGAKFDKRFDDVYAPAVEAAGLKPYRVDRDPAASIPVEYIERGIRDSAAVFVDISTDNPNVWFELGFAIASQKDLCIVCSTERVGNFPFDIQHRKIIRYAAESPRDFEFLHHSIMDRIKSIINLRERREELPEIVKDPKMLNLKEIEAAALACLLSEMRGIDSSTSHWQLKSEMERTGYNSLATNVAARHLLQRGLISVETEYDSENDPYEAYRITESGWGWVSENFENFNLTAKKPSLDSGIYGFGKDLDDEIPF